MQKNKSSLKLKRSRAKLSILTVCLAIIKSTIVYNQFKIVPEVTERQVFAIVQLVFHLLQIHGPVHQKSSTLFRVKMLPNSKPTA